MKSKIENNLKVVEISKVTETPCNPLPVFMSSVQAGFPSPADDYIEKQLDLHELMVQHPAATFFVKVEGESMRDAGIHTGDILVVDRSIEATNGKIVVAVVDGEFTVKRLSVESSGVYLVPENPNFSKIKIDDSSEFQVWGVVMYVIHKAS
ncbi:MAG: translesion error-prone DNA polymerase V autoproteolytic subunit [Chlamydiota bacterium]|nr:translesion error-prone DNA polymerase V autoproteolytic subunit [Chlamydiota bacterium]